MVTTATVVGGLDLGLLEGEGRVAEAVAEGVSGSIPARS